MVEIFTWKAPGWTSPTRPDGTISAFLPLPPLSPSSSRHFTSYILFMCGFSFSLQNGTLGIVGEIIAFEWRQEVLMLCFLFYCANEEKHDRATYLSQFRFILFLQGMFWGRFRSSSKQEVFSLVLSPALAHAFSLHPAVSCCYLKLCGSVQPWNQDLQKVCKMWVTCHRFDDWLEPFSTEMNFLFLTMFPTLNSSGNVENLNLENLSKCTNILALHHSSGQDNCCFQNRTHEAWEGGAEAQLTFSLPSPLLPLCSIRSAPPPPVPTFLLPVSLALLDLTPSSSSKPQSAKPNVLPRAGEHFHHRLHQSASEVWRAHCAGVSNKLQMLLITSVNETSFYSLF